MARRILHVDFNCFFAAVECLHDPSIRSYPVAVTGDPERRHGIVLAKNELAKKFGVKTGEAIWQARQKCPNLHCVAPHYDSYVRFSGLGRSIYHEYSDRIEAFGLDENWVDVTGSTETIADAAKVAEEIRHRVREELGITVSIGVAENKVFAKLGSDLKKPDAVSVISSENYREVAWQLPVEDLLMVGCATKVRLNELGITTIGELATCNPAILQARLGKNGLTLHRFANGLDASPVAFYGEEPPVKSIGNGVTAPRDLVNDTDVRLTLLMLCESVAERLRSHGFRATTVSIAVRDCGLYSFTRQKKLAHPTFLTEELLETAMLLFAEHYTWRCPIRSLTISACDLVSVHVPLQIDLFQEEWKRQRRERAEQTVDALRARFGHQAVLRGRLLSDAAIGLMNPKEEHTVHPVGYRI